MSSIFYFAYSPSQKRSLDVSEVGNGLACGCVCSACNVALVAKQGDWRESHFAHQPGSAKDRAGKACGYTMHESIRAHIRQIVGDELTLMLPAFYHLPFGKYRKQPCYQLSEARTITLTNFRKQVVIEGCELDLVGEIDGFFLGLYITHKGRSVPHILKSLSDRRCGVLSLCVDSYPKVLKEEFARCKNYTEPLLQLLTDGVDSKTWIFHPKQLRAEADNSF